MPRPSTREQYERGADTLNFVVYRSTAFPGEDEVLQHKRGGVELAHITLHPDSTVNFHETRPGLGRHLRQFVSSGLAGFSPAPSRRLVRFLGRIRPKLPR